MWGSCRGCCDVCVPQFRIAATRRRILKFFCVVWHGIVTVVITDSQRYDVCCSSDYHICNWMVRHPRCVFINYNSINQLSNTTIWWLDICCLLHRYQLHISALMAIFRLIDWQQTCKQLYFGMCLVYGLGGLGLDGGTRSRVCWVGRVMWVHGYFCTLWQPSRSHGTYQHEAITSRSRQLLMMGTWLPETCWATIRREIQNTKSDI